MQNIMYTKTENAIVALCIFIYFAIFVLIVYINNSKQPVSWVTRPEDHPDHH